MNGMKLTDPTIIVTDDDEDDKSLIVEALVENGIKKNKVLLASDGDELLKLLPLHVEEPCIVFLDLNMPRKDGRETLVELKKNTKFKHVPVIVFSTSSAKEDIRFTYNIGANTYFTKPFNFRDYVKLMNIVKAYWFEKAIL